MNSAKLYETHVKTVNLERAIQFYKQLDLELAYVLEERRVAFFWLGNAEEKEQMLGVWEVSEDHFVRSHFAFSVSLEELHAVPAFLQERGIELLPSFGLDTSEPQVHTWMPAACYYFNDPDGNSLEYLAVLEGEGIRDLGVVHLSEWEKATQ